MTGAHRPITVAAGRPELIQPKSFMTRTARPLLASRKPLPDTNMIQFHPLVSSAKDRICLPQIIVKDFTTSMDLHCNPRDVCLIFNQGATWPIDSIAFGAT